MKRPRPLCLVVLDGFGLAPPGPGNAIWKANTPNFDALWAAYPRTTLDASGEAVGLLPGQMGNSNVGHLNLGAGRVVYQDLVRITKSIRDGSFFHNPVLCEAVERVASGEARGKTLHLMGLLSDGGVHSDETHVHALLDLAKQRGANDVVLHYFLDGRDVPPTSALTYIDRLEDAIGSRGVGVVGTVMGRYYAMDRDKRWDRTGLAYHAMTLGEGRRAPNPAEAVRDAYDRGETDEFVYPTVIEGAPPVKPGDSVVFWNFRADRARQITRAFVDRDFDAFPRKTGFLGVHFAGMTRYDEDLDVPFAFGPVVLKNTFGEVVSNLGLRQLRIAETEKYAHVTFFFNGGEETPFPREDRRLIPSPKVSTYDRKPEMSAYEVTSAAVEEIRSGKYDVVILNYANLDMVGHTGVLDAAVAAAEAVDRCLGVLIGAIRDAGGAALIVSDHGNAEEMFESADPESRRETNGSKLGEGCGESYEEPGYGPRGCRYENDCEPHTAHTTNPVPCILVYDEMKTAALRHGGTLADVAPTLLEIMGVEKPPEMDGVSLICPTQRVEKK